mmetsp:Transcript_15878/g.31325  ORF Transcript_15878/g.31325 Transcript_15878/m.31325 type:complete len:475 (+) Transcript_15878:122-1546(+)
MKPLKEWSVHDVCVWLESCRGKLGSKTEFYTSMIMDEDIDGEVLVDITHQDLMQLGVTSFGHRHFLLKSFSALRSDSSPGSSSGRNTTSSNSASTGGAMEGMHGGYGWDHANSPAIGPMGGMVTPSGYMPNFNFRDADKTANGITRAAMPRLHSATPRIHESKVMLGRKIGSGSVGNVYAGTFEEHAVAVKRHRPDGSPLDAKALREFEIEVGKMTAVNHPCIVRCFGMLDPTPGIVLELVEGGSLFQIIHAARDETFSNYEMRLPLPVRMRYLLDSMYGLRAVHAAGMIHGDFKTLNMLVGPDHRVKVSDFGLSKCIGCLTVLPGTKTISGTPQYMSPEVMQSQPQGMRVDIYSVGIVMWELLTGEVPWFGMNLVQIIQRVTMKANETTVPPPGRPQLQTHHALAAPVGYIKLMNDAWAQSPNDRPSADMVVQALESLQKTHGMQAFRGSCEGPMQYQMPAHVVHAQQQQQQQ